MEAILPQLLAFPPHPPPAVPLSDGEYDRQIKGLLQTLSTVAPSKLVVGVPAGGDLLDVLDPLINTLPYLHVLLAHIGSPAGKQKAVASGGISESFSPGKPLWQKLLDFMDRFDPVQIRYAGNEMCRLITLVAGSASHVGQPVAAIAPIRSALLHIDSSSSTFTSSHLVFVRLCLEARAYAAALPVLDKDIYHFPASSEKAAESNSSSLYPFLCSEHENSSTYITPGSNLTRKLDYRDHLQYFLYGAMIYMVLGDWERAILFLEVVMTAPTTNNASKIQVDAYKKWILVGMLHRGHMLSNPKISGNTLKLYRGVAKPYIALAEVFKSVIDNEETAVRLVAEANMAHGVWVEDCNSGLVRQVVAAHRRFSVQHLGKTYAALSIADVTRRTSHDPNNYADTGRYITHLLSSGQLNATLTQPSGDAATWILRFVDFPEQGPPARSEERLQEDLLRRSRKIKNLMEHVREADRKLGLSKEYVSKVKASRANGAEEEMWGSQPTMFDQDEDMMADT